MEMIGGNDDDGEVRMRCSLRLGHRGRSRKGRRGEGEQDMYTTTVGRGSWGYALIVLEQMRVFRIIYILSVLA